MKCLNFLSSLEWELRVLDCGTDEEMVEVDEVEEDPRWFKFTVDGKFKTLNKNIREGQLLRPMWTKI